MRGRAGAGAGAGASALLLLSATGPPVDAWSALLGRSTSADPTTAVVAAATLLSWLLALWLAAAVAVAAASALPGGLGRASGDIARRVTPVALRRVVELALGVTLTAALPHAAPAQALAPAISLPASGSAETERVTPLPNGAAAAPARGAAGGLDWPVPAAAAPPTDRTGGAGGPADAAQVVVQRGGCLWDVAAAQLRAEGTAAPTAAQVAQAWPRWWAANREVVGANPDLLHPGMRLTPPPQD